MLVTKFIVPVARQIHIHAVKFGPRNRRCDSKLACRESKTITESSSSKCAESASRLAKCPRKNPCPRKRYPKPECPSKSVVDVYQEIYEDITNQGKLILLDFQNESQTILDRLTEDIKASKNSEQAILQGYLHDIKKTLQKLLALDPTCGSQKRKSAMILSEHVRQALDNVEYDVVPRVDRIKSVIQNLERDVRFNTDRAKSLIASCRKCGTAEALNKCVEENAKYAGKLLEKTSNSAKTALNKIDALQQETLKHHEATMKGITEMYRKESDTFLKQLDDCIRSVKSEKKR